MDKFYLIFSIIIAVCALLSPGVVAWINNRHQLKLRELDIREKQQSYGNEIIDNYFRQAGACASAMTPENLTTFGRYSSLVYFYLPKDFHDDVSKLNSHIYEHNSVLASKALEALALRYASKQER